MNDTLGDRIRAKRDRAQVGPREAAKSWAKTYIDDQVKHIKKVLQTYVNDQIKQMQKASKTYIDDEIAKLTADIGKLNADVAKFHPKGNP